VAACNATHGIAIAVLSICLSVCLLDACIVQGSDTWVRTQKPGRFFWIHPPKNWQKQQKLTLNLTAKTFPQLFPWCICSVVYMV